MNISAYLNFRKQQPEDPYFCDHAYQKVLPFVGSSRFAGFADMISAQQNRFDISQIAICAKPPIIAILHLTRSR